MLLKAMGTTYEDEARLRVVNVQQNTSTAEIVFSCNYVQRGDLAQPFTPRPAPALKSERKLRYIRASQRQSQGDDRHDQVFSANWPAKGKSST